ncbi:MAG: N-acetylmuramoyl-L-alanine amidase [Hyphomicrobiaceae bacterium]
MAVAQQSSSLVSPLTRLLESIAGGQNESAKPRFRRTRFVMNLERPSRFDVYSLVNPNRVVLQLPTMRMALPALGASRDGGLVTTVRRGQSEPGKTKIVIQVAAPVVVENAYVSPAQDGRSAQLLIDIVPVPTKQRRTASAQFRTGKSSRLGAFGLQPPVPRKAATRHERDAKTHKPMIVIDPGHGGHDSGAKKHGVLEKNAVLAFGLKLRDTLLATGRYRVAMTRSTDTFIALDARQEFAKKHNADLFISVHADYARPGAKGATIYSLRKKVAEKLRKNAKKSAEKSAKIAARNSLRKLKAMKVAVTSDRALNGILADLARRDVEAKGRQTNSFTETVIKHMGQSTDFRKQPHRTAAFRVLKTQERPAVLIELAYVSNRRDAKRLQSEKWRKKVAKSITQAVDTYFDRVERLPL